MPTKPSLTFAIRRGSAPERREVLAQSVIKVGRDKKCTLRIDDESVERMHFVLEVVSSDELTLIDLGSNQTTRINGAPVHKSPLKQGDRIEIGQTVIVLESIDPPPSFVATDAAPVDLGAAMAQSFTESFRADIEKQYRDSRDAILAMGAQVRQQLTEDMAKLSPREREQAWHETQSSIEAHPNDAEAQCQMGIAYEFLKRDSESAKVWYARAAAQCNGSPDSKGYAATVLLGTYAEKMLADLDVTFAGLRAQLDGAIGEASPARHAPKA